MHLVAVCSTEKVGEAQKFSRRGPFKKIFGCETPLAGELLMHAGATAGGLCIVK